MRGQNKILESKEELHAKRNEQASGLNQNMKKAKRDFKERKLE